MGCNWKKKYLRKRLYIFLGELFVFRFFFFLNFRLSDGIQSGYTLFRTPCIRLGDSCFTDTLLRPINWSTPEGWSLKTHPYALTVYSHIWKVTRLTIIAIILRIIYFTIDSRQGNYFEVWLIISEKLKQWTLATASPVWILVEAVSDDMHHGIYGIKRITTAKPQRWFRGPRGL